MFNLNILIGQLKVIISYYGQGCECQVEGIASYISQGVGQNITWEGVS